nr:hypothetical protein [Lysinibacillus timonensis]
MQLQSLLEKFTSQLEQHQRLVESNFWCVPVHTIIVLYRPVLRRQMDILMKMLLISVDKAKFKNAQQISEILLVEQLFVQDLLSKMEKMGLIERTDVYYQITDKGRIQLNSGVYEEIQDVSSLELLYSPTHKDFIIGDLEEVLEYEDFPETSYRFYEQTDQLTISEELLLNEVQSIHRQDSGDSEEENSKDPITITAIDSLEFEQVNDIPFIEMIVHDEKNDTFFVRVWNTLLKKWDQELEKQITEKESLIWKERFVSKK